MSINIAFLYLVTRSDHFGYSHENFRDVFNSLPDDNMINDINGICPIAFVLSSNREKLRLLLEFGADVQCVPWEACLSLLGTHNSYQAYWDDNDEDEPTSYHPSVAMLHEVGDYFPSSQKLDLTLIQPLSPCSVAPICYLNYHGSCFGCPLNINIQDTRYDFILSNDLLSYDGRKLLYLIASSCSRLRFVATAGLSEKEQHAIIDPSLLLHTINHGSQGTLSWIKIIVSNIKRRVSPELFQHLMNFCLAQSYRHLPLLKYFAATCNADPNIIVPVLFQQHIIDPTLLQQWFEEEEIARVKQHVTNKWTTLVTSSNWGIGTNMHSPIVGYGVLHLIAKDSVTGNDRRFAYLVKHCNANPYLLTPRRLTPCQIAENSYVWKIWWYYPDNVFQSSINELVLIDNKYPTQPEVWITPLMYYVHAWCSFEKAIEKCYVNCLRRMIHNYHADVNVKDSNGDTVLMRAIRADRFFVVKHLMELSDKHDLNTVNNEGETLQEVAMHRPAIKSILSQYVPASWWKKRTLTATLL